MKKVIEVLNNEGKKIKINEYRFNSEFHKHVGDKTVKPIAEDSVEIDTSFFEFNGKVFKTESAMKAAITRFNKLN